MLIAAWFGWGFDVFDALLFNMVAPSCVPSLLHLQPGSTEAKSATLAWTGWLTCLLLIGWGIGGILFGRVADRLGRSKALILTMLLYSFGTGICAFAPNIWLLLLFRVVASLGIGGEWAAGAAMVAEAVPENRRVVAGGILYTASPIGVGLATFVTLTFQGTLFKSNPEDGWRYVFLAGLIPAVFAIALRTAISDSSHLKSALSAGAKSGIRDLFSPALRTSTTVALMTATATLITWWSCSAFLPLIASELARASSDQTDKSAIAHTVENWKATATYCFSSGGLVGTVASIPIASVFGRKKMFLIYFLLSAVAILAGFGLPIAPYTRLFMYFPIGFAIFGIFGSFTYYLPELFPTRLRATGAGFCYNTGRFVAAAGPLIVGGIASRGKDTLLAAITAQFWVGLIPLAALALYPFIVETRGCALPD